MNSSTVVPAIIAIKMRQYKEAFRMAGATTPRTAMRPADAGLRQSLIFQRLVRQRVLVAVPDGRYYLDETRDLDVTRTRRKILGIVLLVVVLLLVIGFLASREV